MNANMRGLLIFIGIIAVSILLCGWFPSTFLPGQGWAFALPVIQVPGEVYYEGWPSESFVWTNTLTGTLLADALVLLFAAAAWNVSRGWRKEVPGKFQAIVESLVGFLYGQTKSMAGTADIVKKQLFPLVASIFLFLLMANWLELIPGVDSIGLMHCAKPGMSGYGRVDNRLDVDQTLFGGYAVTTEHQFEVCELYLEGHSAPGTAEMTAEEIQAEIAALEAEMAEVDEATAHELQFEVAALHLRAEALEEREALEAHPINEEALAAAQAKVDAGEELTAEEQEVIDLAAEHQLAETRAVYPGALYALTDEQLEEGRIQPYGFIVTPFIRAAATDMNLTFGLALISVVAMQYFGVAALGPAYFQKFVNINALGNANKRPMGLMDFGVGLFEIVSEISKIISLAFRLFGNIFAGQLLLFIIGFLVATLLPVAVYLLEFIVGAIQAYVFAVLTLVFSAQAMVSHAHHDEDEGHH
jgi:F0F1-type ATP synthase membrane subunit a